VKTRTAGDGRRYARLGFTLSYLGLELRQ
jgi:hypothetical protein